MPKSQAAEDPAQAACQHEGLGSIRFTYGLASGALRFQFWDKVFETLGAMVRVLRADSVVEGAVFRG